MRLRHRRGLSHLVIKAGSGIEQNLQRIEKVLSDIDVTKRQFIIEYGRVPWSGPRISSFCRPTLRLLSPPQGRVYAKRRMLLVIVADMMLASVCERSPTINDGLPKR
ncbi:hypothetical protein At15955_50460 (plasmid) [Agrobacterium tumefaciens]|nr:hypothetical protein Ach5_48850 [Agrobacterium tumefaciens]AYM20031.1 hypothetical protein At15955_50460 [Agrobacterium tumefaciens]AYM71334.1 hypothetical protein AtA6_51180 [Agrobacterium tumefaciens]